MYVCMHVCMYEASLLNYQIYSYISVAISHLLKATSTQAFVKTVCYCEANDHMGI